MDAFVGGDKEIRMSFDLESGLGDASATAVDKCLNSKSVAFDCES